MASNHQIDVRKSVASDLTLLNVTTGGLTLRAVTVTLDGVPIGIAGVMHSPSPQAFSVIVDELRDRPITVMKFARECVKLFSLYNTIHAIASDDETNADGFLLHLGFDYIFTNDYGRVYKWPHPQ